MKQHIQNELNELLKLLKEGRACYAKAAKLYCEICNKYPDENIDGFLILNGTSATELTRLEQVGNGGLHPDLMLESATIRNRLIALPASEQERILKQPIPVVKEREGKMVTEYKRLPEMTAAEERLAVGIPVVEQMKAIDASKKFEKLKEQRAIATEKGVQILMPGFFSWDFFHAAEERAMKDRKPVTAEELQSILQQNQVPK